MRAHPPRLSKLDIGVLMPTMPACFGRGVPFVNDDVVFSLFSKLVLEECTKHSESIIRNSFAETERLRHGSQIEVFYTYCVIGIGYLPTELMAKVQSLIGNRTRDLADTCFLFEVSV